MTVKASIHALPTEIKSRIAELCQLQDEAFKEEFEELQNTALEPARQYIYNSDDDEDDGDYETHYDETEVFKIGPFSDSRYEDPDYPKSLISLSCVSKEWRDVAVKFLFRTVRGYRCSQPIFRLAIAPRYGHLVKDLNIGTWPSGCSASNILSSLAYLSHVRTLTLPALKHVCEQLVKEAGGGDFPVEFASPVYVASALRRVTLHAETVTLYAHDVGNTLSVVRGSGLTRLDVMPESGDLPAVLSAIVDCPSLRTLSIMTLGASGVFGTAASLPDLSHPTLRRLEVDNVPESQGLYDFIQRFAPSIEELKVELSRIPSENPVLQDPSRLNLPRLRQLEVSGCLALTAPLIRHISPQSLPALQICTWDISESIARETSSAFVARVADIIRHLRNQQVGRAVPLRLKIRVEDGEDRAALSASFDALGIAIGVEQGGGGGLVVGFKPLPPLKSDPGDLPDLILTPKLCRTDDSKVDDLGKIVRGSLDRIRNLADQAVAVGDRFQISRIAHALQEGEWLCVEREC